MHHTTRAESAICSRTAQSASPLWSPCVAHSAMGPMGGTASNKPKGRDGTAERRANRGSGVVSGGITLGLPISGLTRRRTQDGRPYRSAQTVLRVYGVGLQGGRPGAVRPAPGSLGCQRQGRLPDFPAGLPGGTAGVTPAGISPRSADRAREAGERRPVMHDDRTLFDVWRCSSLQLVA